MEEDDQRQREREREKGGWRQELERKKRLDLTHGDDERKKVKLKLHTKKRGSFCGFWQCGSLLTNNDSDLLKSN